ncbi:VanZ family protein [Vibrio sinensis]|uniref:VanZ family protein n=2 Tax=Vibrio sinensis TaxID=2302434 RepID=A0A3A6QQD1_9VIBR|nr:VanZ family protein [Vibrio sinensis]
MKRRPLFLNLRSLIPLTIIVLAGLASMAKTFSIHASMIRDVELFLGGDWVLHSLISLLLGFSTCWSTPKYCFRNRSFFIPTFSLLVLFAVCADEFCQAISPSRTFSLVDLSINVIGVLLGVLIYNVYLKVRGL